MNSSQVSPDKAVSAKYGYAIGERVLIDGDLRAGEVIGDATWAHPLTGRLVHGYVVHLDRGFWNEAYDDSSDTQEGAIYTSLLIVHADNLSAAPK